jgi:hypothetical protein
LESIRILLFFLDDCVFALEREQGIIEKDKATSSQEMSLRGLVVETFRRDPARSNPLMTGDCFAIARNDTDDEETASPALRPGQALRLQ